MQFYRKNYSFFLFLNNVFQSYFNFSKIVKENNLDEFEKLDDTIFRQILNSKDKKLDASREILKRVTDRRLYKFLGSCVLPENIKLDKKQLEIEVNSFLF